MDITWNVRLWLLYYVFPHLYSVFSVYFLLSPVYDIHPWRFGFCKRIKEILIDENKLTHFSGVEMSWVRTIVLRVASFHVTDEAARSLHDALCVLSQTMSCRRVWNNAGLDSAKLVVLLRAEHCREESQAGIDLISGTVWDMVDLRISEAFKIKQVVLFFATEADEMILKVDEMKIYTHHSHLCSSHPCLHSSLLHPILSPATQTHVAHVSIFQIPISFVSITSLFHSFHQ